MQKGIIKEVREVAQEGKKTFYSVELQDGTRMTTFDAKIKSGQGGDQLDFEVTVNGKFINLKDGWKLTQQSSTTGGGNGQTKYPDMSKEDWAEKDRIERESIESQVAAKLIVKLRIAGAIDDKNTLYKRVLDWCSGKLNVQPKASQKQATDAEKEELFPEDTPPTNIDAIDKLLEWVMLNGGYSTPKTARQFITDVCKIPAEEIDLDPEGVKARVAELQVWTV